MVRPASPTEEQRAKLPRLVGAVGDFRPVEGGFSAAGLWVVDTVEGSVFVKAAIDDSTAGWLRDEARIYEAVDSAFMPHLVCFDDDGHRPILVIEDLSAHRRPPPWTPSDVDAVMASMEQVWATAPPAGVPPADDGLFRCWDGIDADRAGVVASGQLTHRWLDEWLPTMRSTASRATAWGPALVHQDIRSDNLAIGPDGVARFFDWNWSAVGNPDLDLAGWLPSLAIEGGPAPWEVMSNGGPYAAVLAGYFILAASRPLVPNVAPGIRSFQRAQGEVALDWACRELGISPVLRGAHSGEE
jgi:hypothetical protein